MELGCKGAASDKFHGGHLRPQIRKDVPILKVDSNLSFEMSRGHHSVNISNNQSIASLMHVVTSIYTAMVGEQDSRNHMRST
jgi:hypothetical protein